MRNKKNLLKSDLESINKFIITILQSFEYAHYLHYPEHNYSYDKPKSKLISASGFLSFTEYAMWRILIVEIHKLVKDSQSEKFNFFLLLRKLERSGDYRSVGIEHAKVIEWKLALLNELPSIAKVETLRSKLYAHTDRDYKDVIKNSDLTYEEINKLILVIVKIVSEIHSIVYEMQCIYIPIHPIGELKNKLEVLVQNQRNKRNK